MLSYRFTLHQSDGRLTKVNHPEVRLMSLIIISIKLIQGFDRLYRQPRTEDEPAALTLDWEVWKDYFQGQNSSSSSGELSDEGFVGATEESVFQMTGDQLDQYLDWYEQTWVKDADVGCEHVFPKYCVTRLMRPEVTQGFLNLFPTGRSTTTTAQGSGKAQETSKQDAAMAARLAAVLQGSEVIACVSDEAATERKTRETPQPRLYRPGSRYRRYRKVKELSAAARVFYEAVAKLIGVQLETLVQAVFQSELALDKWAQKHMKMLISAAQAENPRTSPKKTGELAGVMSNPKESSEEDTESESTDEGDPEL